MLVFLYRVMKLKLEVKGSITILGVTEDVAHQHVPVLKAGLGKIFESGKKAVVLDLAETQGLSPTTLAEILGIQAIAADAGAQLVLVSPIPGLGGASSRDEAIQMLTSPIGRLMAQEAGLNAKLTRLTKRKIELENALNSTAAAEKEIRKLRKDNSDLKTLISGLEQKVQRLFEQRTTPVGDPAALASRRVTVEKTSTVVLEVAGILQV